MSTTKEELPVAQLFHVGRGAAPEDVAEDVAELSVAQLLHVGRGAAAEYMSDLTPDGVEAVLGKYDRVVRRLAELESIAKAKFNNSTTTSSVYGYEQSRIWKTEADMRRFSTFPPELVLALMDPAGQARAELDAETGWAEVDRAEGGGAFAAAPIPDDKIELALFMGLEAKRIPGPRSVQIEALYRLHRVVLLYLRTVGYTWVRVYRGGRASPREVAAAAGGNRMVADHFHYVRLRADLAARLQKEERRYRREAVPETPLVTS